MTFIFEKQTLARAYAQLASGGEDAERTAIGDFVNAFFLYYTGERQSLLDDPILMPENATEEQRGWAAFCAACAEYFSERYDLQCPAWAHDPAYTLTEEWYHPACKVFPGLRDDAKESAPRPFKKRKVFCGDHLFVNPYPSSREPGTMAELRRRRAEMWAQMEPSERDADIAAYQSAMRGKPRINIVA